MHSVERAGRTRRGVIPAALVGLVANVILKGVPIPTRGGDAMLDITAPGVIALFPELPRAETG